MLPNRSRLGAVKKNKGFVKSLKGSRALGEVMLRKHNGSYIVTQLHSCTVVITE